MQAGLSTEAHETSFARNRKRLHVTIEHASQAGSRAPESTKYVYICVSSASMVLGPMGQYDEVEFKVLGRRYRIQGAQELPIRQRAFGGT